MKIKGTIGSVPFEAWLSRRNFGYAYLDFPDRPGYLQFGHLPTTAHLIAALKALGATIESEED